MLKIRGSHTPSPMPMSKEPKDMPPIEVITSVQRRRRFSAEEKRTLVEEVEPSGSSISAVARKYGINPNQYAFFVLSKRIS